MSEYEVCSYCERKTEKWCPECIGCPECCPTGEHCNRCGMSTRECERTYCGGMAAFDSAGELRADVA